MSEFANCANKQTLSSYEMNSSFSSCCHLFCQKFSGLAHVTLPACTWFCYFSYVSFFLCFNDCVPPVASIHLDCCYSTSPGPWSTASPSPCIHPPAANASSTWSSSPGHRSQDAHDKSTLSKKQYTSACGSKMTRKKQNETEESRRTDLSPLCPTRARYEPSR